MFDAGWAFTLRAGTIILAAMILVWALLFFPYTDPNGKPYYEHIEVEEKKQEEAKDRLKIANSNLSLLGGPAWAGEFVITQQAINEAEDTKNAINGEWKRNSILGRTGLFLEPAFKPLGWDWKIGMAAIASFPAREVIVGTLGLIYDVGDVDTKAIGNESADDEAKEKAAGLKKAVKADWAKDPVRGKYAVPVALSVMVFFALCCQCASTLAVIRRETKSWAWPAFTFTYMTVLAYLGALLTFQLGVLIIG
jgi:ferrous iron transport protein B